MIVSATSVRLTVNAPCSALRSAHRGDIGLAGRRPVAPQHERGAVGRSHVENGLERRVRQRLQVARAGKDLGHAMQRLEMPLRALKQRQRWHR